MEACIHEHEDLVDLLLSSDEGDGAAANVNKTDKLGRSALDHTVMQCRDEEVSLRLVKRLIAAGVNLRGVDEAGWGVVMHAAKRGHKPALEFLLEKYTEELTVLHRTNHDLTPLSVVLMQPTHDSSTH